MKNKLLIIITCFAFIACKNSDTSTIQREGEPAIYSLGSEDKEMNSAINKANETIDAFKVALISKNKNYSLFSLKKRFKTSKGSEHIWLNEISFKDGQYFGIINNEPESITEVKIGDTVIVEPINISDWMYFDQGKVKGGYTKF